MEKNIVEVVMNNKGEVVEKVADYIGVESFAKTIEELYRECLENFDDAEDLEEYIADMFEKNIQSLAWEFTQKVNREMKKYLHLDDQRMDGNFANLYNDYPRHVTGTFWATDYDGDDYYDLYPAMVARLDAAEDSEQANKTSVEFTPDEIKNYEMRAEMIEPMNNEDLIWLLDDIAYEIVIYEWSSTGYCHGDYVEGVAYCDKERFKKMVDTNTKNWKNRAIELFESEVKDIGMWMWGDVKGYILEKKRHYTKMYDDGDTFDSYDWEEIDSCWGEYFEDADDLIEEVIKEHGLQPKDAA